MDTKAKYILGIIPARAGSKGIKDKNIYLLCGKPLIEYTTEVAKKSMLDDFVVSTDDEKIMSMYWCDCMARPKNLAQDDTPMLPVIQYTVKQYDKWHKVDAVCLLQPTSPLRTAEDIDKAIDLFNESGTDSLYSGYYIGIKHKDKTYDKHIDKPHFQRNGAIFITSRELLDKGKLWSDNVIEYEMPKSRSIDIDDMDDMYMAECILKNPKEVI
jgi:CMP-N,N'-diacetyllegionaminic acid synthase